MTNVRLIIKQIEETRVASKQKMGTLVYFLLNESNVYEIHYINISYLKKDRKSLIKQLIDIENREGFLFWSSTPEGEKFYYKNYDKIVEAFNNSTNKPWLDNGYLIIKKEN